MYENKFKQSINYVLLIKSFRAESKKIFIYTNPAFSMLHSLGQIYEAGNIPCRKQWVTSDEATH